VKNDPIVDGVWCMTTMTTRRMSRHEREPIDSDHSSSKTSEPGIQHGAATPLGRLWRIHGGDGARVVIVDAMVWEIAAALDGQAMPAPGVDTLEALGCL